MPKREGYVYDRTSDWSVLKEAEIASSRRKNNYGVRQYAKDSIGKLVKLQHMIEQRTIHTGEYEHMRIKSGQDKWRDISKLKFYPSHIWHQSMVVASDKRIDKALIRDTYASRKGYGQVKAALRLKEWIQKDSDGTRWFAQFDIIKYYDNIPHELLRNNLMHLFKDEEFVDAYMEPFEKYSSDGKKIPLGIRPSQSAGNVALMGLDRYAKETLRIRHYLRYLDDFVIFGSTKGEVKRNARKIKSFVEALGFRLHPVKIAPLSEGLDMLGWVYYDKNHLMYWRKADKKRYLRHRARVTNKKRIRELDNSAWGMIKWGNGNCKKLLKKVSGIDFEKLHIKRTERKDKNGNVYIEAKSITAGVVMGQVITVKQIVHNITTSKGSGRMAWRIDFNGREFKLIVNAAPIKDKIADLEKYHVTKFETVMIDHGANRYDLDLSQTKVIEIDNRTITESEGAILFADTGEKVPYFENN